MKKVIWGSCCVLVLSHLAVFMGGRAVGKSHGLRNEYIAQGFAYEQLKLAAVTGAPQQVLEQAQRTFEVYVQSSRATGANSQWYLEMAFLRVIRARALAALGRQSSEKAEMELAVDACKKSGRAYCSASNLLRYSRSLLSVDWEPKDSAKQ